MYSNNSKYQNIINTAHDLFWKHGFMRVSVEEICRKAGVSKMTFYRFFPNKFELAKTVFDRELEEAIKKWKDLMQADISSDEKIRRIIQMKASGTNDISNEFMEDFYHGSQPELKAYVEKKTGEVWGKMITVFIEAQKKGWFRDDFKPEFLFYISTKFIEIMKDEQLQQLYDTPQELILEFANLVIYGISPRK